MKEQKKRKEKVDVGPKIHHVELLNFHTLFLIHIGARPLLKETALGDINVIRIAWERLPSLFSVGCT